ncbi:ATP-dependent DNA helicase [Lepidopterella palustris CBS 459.81]|uniref:ATP-dependent DNA helicase II subunit 2 n=1 Tax=Lepidopterella palustris CBS 459.81 TaxID=1314670 RepID=A0A8E2JES3_9PEZI|nr:ATP-dependent DNA helicase [Lepidopterella palustris CBS 459.81]
MADKEATVYIVDVGQSMGETNNERNKTNLEWAMDYVWDKITMTVATGRKTALVGVIGLRTDGTDNELGNDDPEEYQNITVLQPLKQTLMEDIRNLRSQIKPSKTNEGDAISALIIAIQMISAQCSNKAGKPLAYKRQIVLVTDGKGPMDPADQLGHITSKIKEDNTSLTIVGVDFDDAEYGTKEEDKSPEKAENEAILKSLADGCDGTFGTLAEAIEHMQIPKTKATRPVHSFKGVLTLGDPENYSSALSIDVERYPRTMVATAPSASNFVVRTNLAAGEEATQSTATVNGDSDLVGDSLTSVKGQRIYQVLDENAPGGKRMVNFEDLSRGFEYGRTAVGIGESESNITKLETLPGLDIIGFVPEDKFERYLAMSRSNVIIAQKFNEKASLAMSSFVHALYEAESYAVARLVTKEGKEPLVLLLAPSIEPDYECLVDVELPFAEDMRGYRFPPLDKKVTVAGKSLTQHRDIPTSDLINAMSGYVDAMDLSTVGEDEDGNHSEYMPMDETYSPILHRINQIIRWRATHPLENDMPDPPAILLKGSAPPVKLVDKAQPYLKAVMKVGDVKKVPPKQKGRKRIREQEKPLSGLDVEELLGRKKRVKVDERNAIPTFKQILATTDDINTIKDAAKQMGEIICSNIRDSLGDALYGRAIENIRVMREELIELEEPGVFNDFVRELKEKILGGVLAGDRREFLWRLRGNKLGLVDKKLSPLSEVEGEEAKEFWQFKKTTTV